MRVCCRGQNKMKQKHSVTFDTILEPQLGQRWTYHKNVYVNKRNVHLNICHRLQKQILSRCVKNMTHADNWTNRWRVFYSFQYVYVQHDLFNNLFLSCYVYNTFLCDRQNKNSEVFPFRKWIRPSYVQFHKSMKQLI